MNHVFKQVWNAALGRVVVTSEHGKSAKKAGQSRDVVGTISTQLNSTQLNSTQLNSTQLNSTQLNSTQLNSSI